ncbi:MAG: hypothetical protein WC670_05555 [Pseudolabrys sp.]|jgi:hypothetical protein
MNNFAKFALAATLTGVMALAAATPSEARHGRNTAAAIGFGAGALVGAAAASSANNGYYGGRYYQEGYAYDPGYTYEPDAYAYEPAPVYAPARRYYYRGGNTMDRTCGGNPGKSNYVPCGN